MPASLWKDELLKAFRDGLQVPCDDPIDVWANEHVYIPPSYSVPGMYSAARSRYMVKPLASLKDKRVRQVNIMSSPRSGKTLVVELFLLHEIANNAGTYLWLNSTDPAVSKFYDIYLAPLLQHCEKLAALKPSLTKECISFPHCTIHLSGAKESAVNGIGYRIVVMDEVWQDKCQELIGQAKTRVGDFQATSKFVLLGQASEQGDVWDTQFNKSYVYEYGWTCPSCGTLQVYEWTRLREDGTRSGINWDKSAKREDGTWDVPRAAKSAWLECHHCKHQVHDNPQSRRYLNDSGDYVCTKVGDDASVVSYRWNSLANIDVPFSQLVTEYLQAKADVRLGIIERLKEFYQQRLAKPPQLKRESSYVDIQLAEYDPNEQWGQRIMGIDCQKDFQNLYYVVRSFQKNGDSRLIKFGRATSWEELREIQKQQGIKDQYVFVDSNYETTKVYQKCFEFSHVGVFGGKKIWCHWWPTNSEFRQYLYTNHPDKVSRYWKPPTKVDPLLGPGKWVNLLTFSTNHVKDQLQRLREGKGPQWLVNDVDEEYKRQLNSEYVETSTDTKTGKLIRIWTCPKGVANHYLDCEVLCLVGASFHQLIGGQLQSSEPLLKAA